MICIEKLYFNLYKNLECMIIICFKNNFTEDIILPIVSA